MLGDLRLVTAARPPRQPLESRVDCGVVRRDDPTSGHEGVGDPWFACRGRQRFHDWFRLVFHSPRRPGPL